MRRMLCGLTSRGYNRLVADLLAAVKPHLATADDEIVRFLASSDASSATWPDDEAMRRSLIDRHLYGWVSQRRIVMVLAAVELHLRTSNRVEDIYTLPANLTIEHAMPQSQKNWSLAAGSDGPEAVDARNSHVHRLGNLTLTSGPLNSSLSNAAWPTSGLRWRTAC